MNSKFSYYWLLILAPVIFISWYFISAKKNEPIRYLPYFGPKNIENTKDTGYHTVPSFEFTDQYGEKVDLQTVGHKIYVAEYFFTTCKSICPVMNDHLQRVYRKFKTRPDFLILSHTVDPETDSVPVLKEYANQHGVNDKKWLFVTGPKQDLYRLARKGYLLSADEEKGDAEDFIHTQNFALVDQERHIRGFYDGTDSTEISKLIQDIQLLYQENDYKAHSGH
jgi:protein SCO1/2